MNARVDGKLNDFLRLLGNRVPVNMPSSFFAAAPAGLAPYSPQMRVLALVFQVRACAPSPVNPGITGSLEHPGTQPLELWNPLAPAPWHPSPGEPLNSKPYA
jgi:hypothetical protein